MRRAVALMSVLIVLTLAALAGTGAMLAAGGSVASARGSLHRAQGRALAWSGVQAAMREIADQRDDLLVGGRPRLTGEWTVYESPQGRGVVRLLPLGGDAVAVSEAAKLDVNVADEASLAKLPGVGKELATRIVAARAQRPFSSPECLLRVAGVTPEMLQGDAAAQDSPRDPGAPIGLLDRVTTFSFDPNVQCGVGEGGEAHRGKLRINLNSGWSEDLGKAIEDRMGAEAAYPIRTMMGSTSFEHDADMVKKLIELKAEPKDWAGALDAFTTTDEPYLLGRVDVLVAGAEVLACIPGVDDAAARAIVAQRGEVPEDQRLSPAWIVAHDILTPRQYQEAADHLTMRSMVWRVRVEAGVEPAGSDEREAPALRDRVVLEAVIDVSSRRPRVAYLRDVTYADAARTMRARLPVPEDDEPAAEETPAPATDGSAAAPPEPEVPQPSPSKPAPPAVGAGAPAAPPAPATKARPAGSGPDRRTGRWTTGPNQGDLP